MIVHRILLLLIATSFSISFQCSLEGENVEPTDKFGFSVGISGSTIVVGAPTADSASPQINGDSPDNTLEDAGAAYTFIRTDGDVWIQEAFLKPTPGEGDLFGNAVAIDGDTIVIGAPSEDSQSKGVNKDPDDDPYWGFDAGAAYVFVRTAEGNWTQQAYLKASNTGQGDSFGWSVSISGDTIVVGAPREASNGDENDDSLFQAGAAYVFVRAVDEWTQQAYLKPINPPPAFLDGFGISVSVAWNTIFVSCYAKAAAFVFERQGNSWDPQPTLTKPPDAVGFGNKVTVSGNFLAVTGNTGIPVVFLYEKVAGSWEQIEIIEGLK
jgi:hypothetical protein